MTDWLILQIIQTAGFSATCGGFIYIGRKLQVLDQMQSDIGKLKHNTKAIADFLITKLDFNPKELKDYSPLELTDKGIQLIQQIGFDSVFGEHKEDFFRCIADETPKLKYEVEIAAIRSIYHLFGNRYMDFLKIYLYQHPARTMRNTVPTLGVYLRDKYLAEHPEITQ